MDRRSRQAPLQIPGLRLQGRAVRGNLLEGFHLELVLEWTKRGLTQSGGCASAEQQVGSRRAGAFTGLG